MHSQLNFIAGRARAALSGATLEVVNPATGAVMGSVPESDERDVDAAVRAAREAFPAWSGTPAAERSALLLKFADEVERNADKLARLETENCGKPIAASSAIDIPRSVANLRYFATAVLHTANESHDFDGGGVPGGVPAVNYTLRRPRGVAGCISPWNLPLYLLTWKIAPALATGNTVVAKPSEVTPLTAGMLGELANRAGLPAGVLNIVHGRGDRAGAAIVEHPDVPTITFTGSTKVGKWIGETCGRMLKRASLELGGKNPFVVFDDADIEGAIGTAVRAGFSNQGQVCLCGSRLLVQQGVLDRVLEGLVAGAAKLRIGDPLDPATQFGSLTSAAHLEKVEKYVRLARELGGKIHCGGERVKADRLPERCRGGAFFAPTVISGLDPACAVEQEEIFGPVVTVQAFRDEEQVLALANGTPYGLAATVFTSDVARAHRFAARVESGIVWVNCWLVRDLRTPFGGVKQSGVGREGGLEAIRFFTEAKNVCVRV